MKRAVILRSTPIDPDPRASKTATWLSREGWEVCIVGWDRYASLPVQAVAEGCKIVRVPLRAGFGKGLRLFLPLMRWQIALISVLYRLRHMYDFIHAADFDTILPALLMARLFRKRVVYDIYDFYADSRTMPVLFQKVVHTIEIWAAGKADAVVLVDESRRRQIRGARVKRLEIIYNSPEALALPPTSANDTGLRIAYVGILTPGRSLLELLQVLRRHPEWHFDIAGFGHDESLIREAVRDLPNVRYHGRISYTQALDLYAKAAVIIAIYNPSIPNHCFSSPNKLFEAMMLGKPIIVARGSGVDEVVTRHRLGFAVTYGDLVELERALSQVASWQVETRTAFAWRAREVYDSNYSSRLMQERLGQLYQELSSSGIPKEETRKRQPCWS